MHLWYLCGDRDQLVGGRWSVFRLRFRFLATDILTCGASILTYGARSSRSRIGRAAGNAEAEFAQPVSYFVRAGSAPDSPRF
jgi:hypothetical protein